MRVSRLLLPTVLSALLLLISMGAAATMSARVDRHSVAMGETFMLVITIDSTKAPMPDLSVLNGDFQVVSTAQSSQVSIINDQRSSEKTWHIELLPRHLGQVTIPALSSQGERTEPGDRGARACQAGGAGRHAAARSF